MKYNRWYSSIGKNTGVSVLLSVCSCYYITTCMDVDLQCEKQYGVFVFTVVTSR